MLMLPFALNVTVPPSLWVMITEPSAASLMFDPSSNEMVAGVRGVNGLLNGLRGGYCCLRLDASRYRTNCRSLRSFELEL